MPSATARSMIPWTSLRAPTSTPWVGSSSSSTVGSQPQAAAEHDLLLVAARQRGDGRLGAGGRRSRAARSSARVSARSAPRRMRPKRRRSRRRAMVRFSRTAIVANSPSRAALARARRPCRPAAPRAGSSPRRPAVVPTSHVPASRGRWPVSSGMIDSRPEPSSPATPTTSPRPTSTLSVGDAAAGDAATARRQRSPIASPRPVAAAASATARPTISSTSWSWSSAARCHGGDPPAVAQHGDAVGDRRAPRRGGGRRAGCRHRGRAAAAARANRRSTSSAGSAAVGSSSTSTCVAPRVVVDGAGDREAWPARPATAMRRVACGSTSRPRSAIATRGRRRPRPAIGSARAGRCGSRGRGRGCR